LEPTIDVPYDTNSNIEEWNRLDHLLAVFCISRRPKPRATASEGRAEPGNCEMGFDRSPWILPVYVLSREQDEYRHLIPKEAKCTIDTGNLQGNIVSKAFVVDVLGYTKTDFHKLTKEEEDGGAGITGHKLIPDGAIYLTGYHNNSTRVFRDMRFLVSEHPMYDLIIGARSIWKHNILDVPNLVNGGGGGWKAGWTGAGKRPTNDTLNELESTKIAAKKELTKWGNKRSDYKDDNKPVPLEIEKNFTACETKFDDAKKNYETALEDFCRSGYQNPKIAEGNWTAQDFLDLFEVKTGRPLSEGETKKGQ
jgi:hypothetical protein